MTNQFTFLFLSLFGLAACAVPNESLDAEEEEEDVATIEEAFWPDCPDNAEPCECVLRGTTSCTDPDGDGVVNLYDNCDYQTNPNQSDCDGDGSGDACDSQSGTVSTGQSSVHTGYDIWTSHVACYNGSGFSPAYPIYSYFNTQTITYCAGPQTGQTETLSSSFAYERRAASPSCWKSYGGCSSNNVSSPPSPVCPF